MNIDACVQSFSSRADASVCAAEVISSALRTGLVARRRASFVGSGGTSPTGVYQTLSATELDWENVTIGLVDERWIPADHVSSNERLLREQLLVSKACSASFLPMKTDADTPQEAAPSVDQTYRQSAPCPYDAALLGMGPDGHTASWFPGASGLDKALDPDCQSDVISIDAKGAPVAGSHPLRMTLTLAAISSARAAVLLAFGDEKRDVLGKALLGPTPQLPVSYAIDKLGDRLTLMWAP